MSLLVEVVKDPSSFKGKPAVFFLDGDVFALSAPFKLALVGKFSRGRPTMEELRKFFQAVGYKGVYSLGWLDPRHVLITFTSEEDY